MLPHERYSLIIDELNKNQSLKIEKIMDMFSISIETARRDLSHLEEKGLLKKVYGGAISSHPAALFETASDLRLKKNQKKKQLIAKKCAEFINDGDTLLLEIGTTVLEVAKQIKTKKNLTVITNSIFVINELLNTEIELYVIGGKIRHEEKALSGAISTFDLDNFNITKAILGAGAISSKNGLSDYNIEESLIRKKIISKALETIIVADSSKFGYDALVNIAPISSLDLIITDFGLPKEQIEKFNHADANLIIVSSL